MSETNNPSKSRRELTELYPTPSVGRLKQTDDPSDSYSCRSKIITVEKKDDIQHQRRENNLNRKFDDNIWLLSAALLLIAAPFYIFRTVSPIYLFLLRLCIALIIFLFVYALIRALKNISDSKARDKKSKKK